MWKEKWKNHLSKDNCRKGDTLVKIKGIKLERRVIKENHTQTQQPLSCLKPQNSRFNLRDWVVTGLTTEAHSVGRKEPEY